MKLSEAIRLGSMLKPQAFGETWSRDLSKTCAMAAAIEAAKVPMYRGADTDAPALRPVVGVGAEVCVAPPIEWWAVLRPFHTCPECRAVFSGVQMISHLNDVHLLTREQIADWVESIERQQEPSNTDVPPASLEVVR